MPQYGTTVNEDTVLCVQFMTLAFSTVTGTFVGLCTCGPGPGAGIGFGLGVVGGGLIHQSAEKARHDPSSMSAWKAYNPNYAWGAPSNEEIKR